MDHRARAKLVALLPDGHDALLFANSGSEANDTALKLIRYYWNLKGRPEKKIHLSREYSYHGVTMAAASLSGLTPHASAMGPAAARFRQSAGALLVRRQGGGLWRHRPGRVRAADRARNWKKKFWRSAPDRVASFSAEPVQGAGGLIFPPVPIGRKCSGFAAKYDVLLHVDEVITGFGRTGEWFGAHTYDMRPTS